MLGDVLRRKSCIKKMTSAGIQIKALICELAQADFQYNAEYDKAGHVARLFCVHPLSMFLSK